MCSCPLPHPSIHGHLKFQTKHGSSADDKEASDSRGEQTLGGETNRVCVCVFIPSLKASYSYPRVPEVMESYENLCPTTHLVSS